MAKRRVTRCELFLMLAKLGIRSCHKKSTDARNRTKSRAGEPDIYAMFLKDR